MSSVENNSRRVRLVLELLAKHPNGLPKTSGPDSVFPQVFLEVPADESEAVMLKNGLSRGESALTWSTVDLVKAGWLTKSGTGLWAITTEGRQAVEEYPDAAALVSEARNRYNAWSALNTTQKQELLRSTIIPSDKDEEAIRSAALLFVERGLLQGDSVFAPGRAVWDRAPVEELRSVFIDAPDTDAGTFVEKVKLQMANVTDEARLLMAELACWQLLPIAPNGVGERAKKK